VVARFVPVIVAFNNTPQIDEFGVMPNILMGAVTVKLLKSADVPAAVFTVTVRSPSGALAAIVMVMGREVGVPKGSIVAVTPEPLKVTSYTPIRYVPVIVALMVVPCIPTFGVIAVTVGGGSTIKPLNGDDAPTGVVAAKVRSPVDASGATEIVTGRVVGVPPLSIVAVTPVPLNVTAVAPCKSLPEIVALTAAPGAPAFGVIDVITGTVAGPH
jgi:hypothetical protein